MSEFDSWQNNGNSAGSTADNGAENSSREGYSVNNRESSKPAYKPVYSSDGGERQYSRGDRPQRPRFNRAERAYSSDGVNNERGFRPQGMNDGYRQQQYGHRNYNGGNYRQNNGRSNGYGYDNGDRPSYNNRNNSSYGQGYNRNNNQGGYGNQGYNRQGGYGNQGGYNRQGGYNNQGGYNRQGGYGNQGGYQRKPRYNNQGGYGNQGGYNNRGGMQRGGMRQRTPGYDPNAKYSMKKRIEYKEYLEDPNAPIRLNKFLANAGICSRREADQFIQSGVVKVNGEVVTELGTKVVRTDTVHFHDQPVSIEKKVYVLLNKPKDYVTTSDDPQSRKTVMDLVRNCCNERIYPVGRLDRNTTGVLLFTNDGDLASKLTHPKYLKKKIYHVYLDKNVAASDLQRIAEGITLEDGEVHADAISYASDTDKSQVGIEIHSGKNRIVRRIFEALGYKVVKLDRVMFAGLTKKGLKRGDWRFLTEQEVAMLHMQAGSGEEL